MEVSWKRIICFSRFNYSDNDTWGGAAGQWLAVVASASLRGALMHPLCLSSFPADTSRRFG